MAAAAAEQEWPAQVRAGLAAFLDHVAADPGDLPETLEDSLVGGIVWMVHQRLLRGEARQVPHLLPTMLEFALAPYLGEDRAAAVAAGG